MIVPALSGTAFLEDVARARSLRDGFSLWWLGQSGFLVQWQGRHLLLDPYLSDSLTEKYARSDKPHIRMTERVIAPEQLDFIDVVTSSHNHTDHLDAQTLLPLLAANPRLSVLVAEANREFAAARLGLPPETLLGLDVARPVEVAGFRFFGVPAAHEELEQDSFGHYRYLGLIIQFGPWTLYHSGDTVLYEGLIDRLRRWTIDVALLPINGRGPERRVAGNMWGREAVQLARAVEARLVIPCHYEMFTFNTASPEEFQAEAARLGQPIHVLRCGERADFSASPV